MPVNITIPELGNKFQDYRNEIIGDSYNWGPVIIPNNIVNFTFHHSVTKQTAKIDNNWKVECDKIANSHINPPPNGNGWGGVGYRFIICSNGMVAYVGDLSHGGSAVANKNDTMFSACLVGDFTRELPTAAQIHSAHVLAKHFLTLEPNYPQLNNWDDVKGHKEFTSTACPGTNWKTVGDNLYTRIKDDKWQGYPDPQPGGIPVPPVPPVPPTDPCEAVKKELVETKIKLEQTQQELVISNDKLNKIKGILV